MRRARNMNEPQVTIRLDMIAKDDAGEMRHAVDIMQSLGITYASAEPQPMADQWQFYGCQNVPAVLPAYLELIGPIELVK